MVIKAGYATGFVPTEAAYRVTFTVAPVAKCDYMKGNELFNLFLRRKEGPRTAEIDAQIGELAKRFAFGDTLDLRAPTDQGRPAVRGYTYSEPPENVQALAEGEILRVGFGRLPREAGIPFVTVSGTVHVRAFTPAPTTRKANAALQNPTPYWPSDDGAIQKLAKEITANAPSDAEKVQALLDWLMPRKNLKYEGVTGSRYGVKQALAQGFGHCWDFSDLFITLARASGIPCRQVGGWLYGQSGHIWAEVLVDGKAWQQVDPTCGMPCGSQHVPYFTSEDGEMPIVYLSMPEILLEEKKVNPPRSATVP